MGYKKDRRQSWDEWGCTHWLDDTVERAGVTAGANVGGIAGVAWQFSAKTPTASKPRRGCGEQAVLGRIKGIGEAFCLCG